MAGVGGRLRRLRGHARRRPAADPARAAAAPRGDACRSRACRPCAWSRASCGGRGGSRACASRWPATRRRRPRRARCSRSCAATRCAPFLDELLPELADDPDGLAPVPRAGGAALRAAAGARRRSPPASPWRCSSPAWAPGRCCSPPLGAGDGLLRCRAAGWRLRGRAARGALPPARPHDGARAGRPAAAALGRADTSSSAAPGWRTSRCGSARARAGACATSRPRPPPRCSRRCGCARPT